MPPSLSTAIELRIVAMILHSRAGVGDGGAIAREQPPHLGQAQTAHHMREIHGDLAGKGDFGTAAPRRVNFVK